MGTVMHLAREPPELMAKLCRVKWRPSFFIRVFVVFILSLVYGLLTNAPNPPQELITFLRARIGLTAKEMAGVRRGEVIAKVLPSEQQEVAVFGVVLVKTPPDFFVERFRDIESYKKGTSVPLVKKFSAPPRLNDLDQLKVDKEDFDALKQCSIGSCDVKLSSAAIDRLRKEIDWNAPDAPEKVNKLARVSLLEYVSN